MNRNPLPKGVLLAACVGLLPIACSFAAGPGECDPVTGVDCDAAIPDSGAPFPTAPHSPWPQLVNCAGTVIASPQLVTIVASNDPMPQNLIDFGDTIVNSPWLSQVGSEYGVGPFVSGGHFVGAAIAPGASTWDMSWSDVQDYVQAVVDAGAPAPNGQTLYLMFLPPGVTVGESHIDAWTTFPSADPQGDMVVLVGRGNPLSGENQFDEITVETTSSLFNAITDGLPPLGPAWSLPQGTPPWFGDPLAGGGSRGPASLCGDNRIEEVGTQSSYAFARVWSNTAAARGGDPCVPVVNATYYNVTFPQGWYAVQPGQTVTIPFSGWTTGSTSDWSVYARIDHSQGGFTSLTYPDLSVSTSIGEEQVGNCNPMPGMNNGTTGTLQFNVPSTVVSGDTMVLVINSVFVNPTVCGDPPPSAGDAKHHNVVGVYVP
jgi:hypothetical protein